MASTDNPDPTRLGTGTGEGGAPLDDDHTQTPNDESTTINIAGRVCNKCFDMPLAGPSTNSLA